MYCNSTLTVVYLCSNVIIYLHMIWGIYTSIRRHNVLKRKVDYIYNAFVSEERLGMLEARIKLLETMKEKKK